MRNSFQYTMHQHLKLRHNTLQNLKSYPCPKAVQLDCTGFTILEHVKKKTSVYPGMLLAEHPLPHIGDLFAPIHGTIDTINKNILYITATEPNDSLLNEHIKPLPYNILEDAELTSLLKKFGISLHTLINPCETLIINCLNPEPGMTWAEALLQKDIETLVKGFEVCKHITQAKNIILALPKGMTQPIALKNIATVYIKPIYPNNLDPLVLKKITKETLSKNMSIISIKTVWSIGRVIDTGKPLTETILTIGNTTYSENYIVQDGTTIQELMTFNNLKTHSGDTVIIGGLFQGKSVDQLEYGITKETTGIFITTPTTTPSMERQYPCINCSACVSICPARLNPDLLSRYTEFRLYEKCRKEFIDACFECGLCSYVCIARRPILEHIRLAKHTLTISNNATTYS